MEILHYPTYHVSDPFLYRNIYKKKFNFSGKRQPSDFSIEMNNFWMDIMQDEQNNVICWYSQKYIVHMCNVHQTIVAAIYAIQMHYLQFWLFVSIQISLSLMFDKCEQNPIPTKTIREYVCLHADIPSKHLGKHKIF